MEVMQEDLWIQHRWSQGEQEDLEAFGLEPEESVDTLREKIRESIEQTSEGEEVLILTDLFMEVRLIQ